VQTFRKRRAGESAIAGLSCDDTCKEESLFASTNQLAFREDPDSFMDLGDHFPGFFTISS